MTAKKIHGVCSYHGLLRISNGTEKILNTNTGFNDNTIRGIVENDDGTYWVATNQSGIYRITEDFDVITHLNTTTGLSSNFVLTVVKGKTGEIYTATKNGLDIIQGNKIVKRYNVGNGLIEDMVFNIYQDADNILWIATIGGLSMVKGDQITNFNKKDGLLDDKIFDVIEDSLGYMWLPTINGILRIEKRLLVQYSENKTDNIFSVSYGKSDGMHDQQYVGASKALKLKERQYCLKYIIRN
ncbi:MAG: hypothetical protein HC831_00355 [Chloroflexia bacterium]|nr:hypothetical protein [Chloroflexia bacterium]